MKSKSGFKGMILVLMGLVSLTNLFGVAAAGLSVIIGLVAFFGFKIAEKQTLQECGLDIKSIGKGIKIQGMWLWLLMPSLMNFLVIFLAKIILPDYVEHVVTRSGVMLNVNMLPILMVQLLIFALIEEIAWRGFFQRRLQSHLSVLPAIVITSILFSLGHMTSGSLIIVAYDLLFIFVNSLIYGFIFSKSNNIWLSTVSHFIANTFAVIILFFL